MRFWQATLIFLAGLALYGGSLAYLGGISTDRTDGKLTYIYDDAYIHMGIAENVVNHRVWGVTPYAFTSTTSSPLWTVILSLAFAVGGVSESVPLLLNVIAGVLLMGTLVGVWWRLGVSIIYTLLGVGMLFLFMPLSFMTFAGMEHILHTWLTLLTMLTGGLVLQKASFRFQDALREPAALGLLALAPLLPMARYEGIFLVFVICVLLLLRGRWQFAVIVGVLAWLPIIAYGVINVANEWFILPGSVVIKSSAESPPFDLAPGALARLAAWYPQHGYLTMARNAVFTALMLTSVGLLTLIIRKEGRLWSLPSTLLIMVAGMGALHFTFAAEFIRYYPYIIAAGVFAAGIAAHQLLPNPSTLHPRLTDMPFALGMGVLFVLAIAPMVDRGWDLLERTPGAMTNIYDQQYQMALFLEEHYDGERVAMNDIGTTIFLTDIRLLDLVGLGTLEVAQIVVDDEPFGAPEIHSVAADYGAQIAVVYDAWYDIPPEWIPVGYWQTSSWGFLGSDVVTFYAIDPAEEERLIAALQAFEDQLSDRVTQFGVYTKVAASTDDASP